MVCGILVRLVVLKSDSIYETFSVVFDGLLYQEPSCAYHDDRRKQHRSCITMRPPHEAGGDSLALCVVL